MSRNILYNAKKLFQNKPHISCENYIYVPFFSASTSIYLFYVLSSKTTKTICITDKYMFTQNGFTNFMVVDKDCNHYNVNNSFWFWKWDSIEDWIKIQPNDSVDIICYGYRIPILSVFPNIVSSVIK